MNSKNQRGFTLTELVVAMAISLVVLGAVASIFRVQTRTIKAQEYKMEGIEYARVALDMMSRELRNAGFFRTGTACSTPANTSGIATGTVPSATTLRFVYDANGDGLCNGTLGGPAGADEDVTYTLTASDITRAVNGGTPQALTGGNVNQLQFRYFGGNGTEITNMANVPANAKRISISITVQSRSTDTQFGGGQTITMTSNVDLRNRCNPAPCTQM